MGGAASFVVPSLHHTGEPFTNAGSCNIDLLARDEMSRENLGPGLHYCIFRDSKFPYVLFGLDACLREVPAHLLGDSFRFFRPDSHLARPRFRKPPRGRTASKRG